MQLASITVWKKYKISNRRKKREQALELDGKSGEYQKGKTRSLL